MRACDGCAIVILNCSPLDGAFFHFRLHFLEVIFMFCLRLALRVCERDEHTAGGPLRRAGRAQILLRPHVHVGHAAALGQRGQVRHDIDRRDVRSEEQHALLALPERFDDLFDSAAQRLCFRGALHEFVALLLQFVGLKKRRER